MIQGRDFLTLADTWIKGATEAEWRSAVSRAYYAAFHEARQLLRALGFQVPRADQAHAYLWLRLSNCGDPQVQVAGAELNRLRRERNRADYDVDQTLSQSDALLYVQAARRITQALSIATTEPTRTQITDAMKVYERDVLQVVTWQP
jgi:uncharacterized protein (UPF0332 family)